MMMLVMMLAVLAAAANVAAVLFWARWTRRLRHTTRQMDAASEHLRAATEAMLGLLPPETRVQVEAEGVLAAEAFRLLYE